MATYTYSPPNRISLAANPSSTQKGLKYRIYNIFKPTVVLDEISMKVSDSKKEKKPEDMAGLQYPFIKINNYFITEQELEFLKIDCTNFLPIITLQVTFFNNIFIDREMPKDGDIISVSIRNKTDALKMIRNDYVITSHVNSRRNTSVKSQPQTITFFGELFVPGLRSYTGSKAYRGTSMDVMKTVAKELQLGFNTNDNDTDDYQIWMAVDSPDDFMQHVTQRSWKNEHSFYESWIDIYYNLNFVNIQKQIFSSEEVDDAASLYNVDTDWTYGPNEDQKKTALSPKCFSNYLSYRTTSFYISDWKPINKSSAITFQYGTSIYASFYEHLNSLYEIPNSQKYWNLKIDPDYDKDKLKSHILLRGRAKYDPNNNTKELARANYSYQDLYSRAPWMGIQYTITNSLLPNSQWTGNQHKNYIRAQVHHAINMAELEKLNLEITVQGTNTNIITGDKIPVIIVGTDPIDNQQIDPNAQGSTRKNEFYSGWYLVKGFTLNWSSGTSLMSNFSQTFLLTRREWPTPIPVDAIP